MNSIAHQPIVLAVNRHHSAIGFRTVAKAIKSMCGSLPGQSEPASAIDIQFDEGRPYISGIFSWEEWIKLPVKGGMLAIMTTSGLIRVPDVIVEPAYVGMPIVQPKRTRRAIFVRDGYTCQYCAKQFAEVDLNIDHVIPRDMGGLTTWENTVCSCIKCNSRKANRLPHQAGMALLKRPRAPKGIPVCALIRTPRMERQRAVLIGGYGSS